MIIIKFRQYLLHYGFPEKNGLRTYPELIAIPLYCRQFTIIQIDNLPMATYKRRFLLLQIFRIDARYVFLLLGHGL